MKRLLKKYEDKLVSQGLCEADMPLLGGLDAQLVWNKNDSACRFLEKVISSLSINSILFAKPAEPYFSILNYLSKDKKTIYPQDSETRTFLHDIPVCNGFDIDRVVGILKQRKSVVIAGEGILTFGIVSPEQAFIIYSSVCFAGFVKFFTDYLYCAKQGTITNEQKKIYEMALARYKSFIYQPNNTCLLEKGPFRTDQEVISAIIKAGKMTVDCRLVDSFFGNVSYRFGDAIYISQTASSLDELSGCIDPCPLDESSCTGITASSELSAHRDIFLKTNNKAVLHGHPKFCVIMSLFCENKNCKSKGKCHIKCPEKRFIADIPIVPGEVGTGPYGLCHTLPGAIADQRGAIVYGHGLFTVGASDFTDAFSNLMAIEKMCIDQYLKNIPV